MCNNNNIKARFINIIAHTNAYSIVLLAFSAL